MRVPPLVVALSLATMTPKPSIAQPSTPALPTYTAEQRWARAAELNIATNVTNLMQAKERGLTAEAYGQERFKASGPPRAWTTQSTPIALFRTMYLNFMSHPQQQCVLLEASENRVRAECNRPYVASVRSRTAAYGVTLEEYDAAFFAFAQAITQYHKMTWERELRLDNVIITIRKP